MSHWLNRWLRRKTAPSPPTAADELTRLGSEVVALYEQGRYAESRAAAALLVERQRAAVGETHPEYATAVGNLGLLAQKQGDLAEAERLLRTALEIRRAALGDRHPHSISNLAQLADLLLTRGALTEAEPLLRESLERLREGVGEEHPDYATVLTSLALLAHRRGNLEESERSLRQVLAIRGRSLGEQHPQYATALSNLAQIVLQTGAHDEAESLLRRALEIRVQVLGDRHPDNATTLSQLAQVLLARGDQASAEPFLRRAVDLRKTVLGEGHPDVVADLNRLAAIASPVQDPAASFAEGERAEAPVAPAPSTPEEVPETPADEPEPPASSTLPAVPAAADSSISPPTEARVTEEPRGLDEAIARLARRFERLGDELTRAARLLFEPGELPAPRLVEEAMACREEFASLDRAVESEIAEFEPVLETPDEGADLSPASLARLRQRLARLDQLRTSQAQREGERREATSRLSRIREVLAAQPNAEPYRRLLDDIDALVHDLAVAPTTRGQNSAAAAWFDGSHTLQAFLRLAAAGGQLDDAGWLALYRTVATAYGGTVAAAAARQRFASLGADPSILPSQATGEGARALGARPSEPRPPSPAELTDAALGLGRSAWKTVRPPAPRPLGE